ncbi:MAG: hypothetical protein U9N86_07895 [Bacteroidota bacterium]|nr:hypothetical protein [Bacteroidota bacterium]
MKSSRLIPYPLVVLVVLLLLNCSRKAPVDKQINDIEAEIEELVPDVVLPDSLPVTDTISVSETEAGIQTEQKVDSSLFVEQVTTIEEYEEAVLVLRDDQEILPYPLIPIYNLSYRYAFKHERRLSASNYVVYQIEAIDKNRLRITALGSFTPYYLPMEKVFSKLDYPWGGSIEFSRQNWPVSFGVGYNAMKAQSASLAYHLQSNNIYLFGKYTPLKLFNDKLEFFLTAGVTSWAAQISNVKYPEHEDYYPTETNRGYSYYGGAGTLFEFHKFLIGLQYQLYGTPLVVFGADFNEPDTQEGLKDYTPSTQYKLHAGTNQLQIIVGYRIN